jgi:hypothetical protein
MSDVTLGTSTELGTRSTPSNPTVNRHPTTRNNTISDFFRVRIPRLLAPALHLETPVPAPDPIIPHHVPPPTLIPVQVIMTSNTAHSIPVPHPAPEIQPAPPPRTTLQRLEQSQTTWAAMFHQRLTLGDGHRPIILSVENQRTNASWGDVLKEKQDHITRIYGMNVNGLSLDQRGGQLDVLCKVIKEVQADVFCGQEHNLDTDNTQVRQILYTTSRHHWTRSRITFGTTPIAFSKHYKPGGHS